MKIAQPFKVGIPEQERHSPEGTAESAPHQLAGGTPALPG
jgi:hypothetical protein